MTKKGPKPDAQGEFRTVRVMINLTPDEARRLENTGVSARELILQALETYR